MESYRTPGLFFTLFRALCAQIQLHWNDPDDTDDEKLQDAADLIAKSLDTSGEHVEVKGLPLVENCKPEGDFYNGFCAGLVLGNAIAKFAQLGLTTADRDSYD